MKISYNWLKQYIHPPTIAEKISAEKVAEILTNCGLEVENIEHYQGIDGYQSDVVFEIGLTPNRSDATSLIGVARDLIAVLKQDIHFRKINLIKPCVENFKIDKQASRTIDVIVEDTDACPRYCGLTITDIKVGESPLWMRNRLQAIGLKPINNIVDITNFVMYETGQPLHAFDADDIIGNKVIVKKLLRGTKFITLDEVERELTENDLMICNEKEPMCIAGVFGGKKSGISDKTKNLFLECACFNPVSIRRTSKYHGLFTDSAFRFERGIDPNNIVYALKRAALLIKEIAGGLISSDIIDIYPNPIKPVEIYLLKKNVDRLIEQKIARNDIKRILTALEFEIISENKEGWQLLVPTFKCDVYREVDVVEEILRIYGMNKIEIPSSVRSSLTYTIKPDKDKIQDVISDYLSSNGFYEIMTNSLTKSKYPSVHRDKSVGKIVSILNPISKELDVMRQTLLFGGLEVIANNYDRKTRTFGIKLYEIGKVYYYNEPNYIEEEHLALFISGRKYYETWETTDEKADFYYLKNFVQNVIKRIGVDFSNLIENSTNYAVMLSDRQVGQASINEKIFEYGLAYKSASGQTGSENNIVEFGKVNKEILKLFDLDIDVFYADFNLDNILNLLKLEKTYKEIPKYPAVRRDLALLIDKDIQFEKIKQLSFDTERKILKQVNLFDIYEGESLITPDLVRAGIEKGKKSYAISFILQDETKTLTDEEIDKTMKKLIKTFQEKIGATIR